MIPDFLAQAFSPDRWPTFVFLTARLGGMMTIAPLWSMTTLPKAARAAITVVLALALLPACPPVHAPEETFDLLLPLALEGLVGLAIGLTAAVLVQGMAMAGEVVSLQMGLSLGPVLAPTPDVAVPGVAQLQTILALLVYASLDGHLMLLKGLADSLRVLPPGSGFGLSGEAAPVVALLGTLFTCAVRAAAPVMVALLLANLALAVLSRAVPQLNAMMVAFPITIGVGLIMIGASVPVMTGAMRGWTETLPAMAAAALRGFQPAGGP